MGVLPAQQPEAATAPAATAMPGPELLIDQFLPRYDFAAVHAQVFRVPPEVCLRAARRVDLLRHPAIRSLIGPAGVSPARHRPPGRTPRCRAQRTSHVPGGRHGPLRLGSAR